MPDAPVTEDRRSKTRTVVIAAATAAAAGLGAIGSTALLTGPLQDAPAETFETDARIPLTDGDAAASVAVESDWTRLGLLPDADELRIVSPDGRYTADIAVTEEPEAAVRTRLAEALGADPADVRWAAETLPSGATTEQGRTAGTSGETTVVLLHAGDGLVTLVAHAGGAEADRYRGETGRLARSIEWDR